MKIRPVKLVLFLALAGSIFLFARVVRSASSDIVINEIKISGGTGKTTDEFIELYNPASNPFNIENWNIYKYTKSSTSTNDKILITTLPAAVTIPALGYFLIAHVNYVFTTTSDSPDITYSGTGSNSLSSDNTVLLYRADDTLVDMVGYGAATAYEIAPATDPGTKSIERKNFVDSDNNYADFVLLGTSTPRNSAYVYTPPINQLPIAIINGPTSTNVGEAEEFDGSDSNDSDGTIVSYQWSIDGEVTGISSVLNYQFATSGSFAISLQVTDDQGASASTSLNIVVSEEETTLPITYPVMYINEFLSDTATSSEHEWIELYNPTTSTVDLIGWTLSDSIGVRSSPTSTIANEGFFVIELSNILNNTGDTITLKNPSGEVVNQVVYGISSLPASSKGNSIARTVDGAGSWQETTTVTKNSANIITAPVVEIHQTSGGGGSPPASSGQAPQVNLLSTNLNSAGRIIINELLPNPKGSDTEKEFIELKNLDSKTIDLTNWILSDASGAKFKIKEGTISPGGFVVFKRSVSNLSLNNSGEEIVKLFNPSGAVIDQIKYAGPAGEDESFARLAEGTWPAETRVSRGWGWTIKTTPGTENVFAAKNLPPAVAVEYLKEVEVGETAVFDASDTSDPESDKLNFVWTTGEEEKTGPVVNFIFERAGERVINLSVDDGNGNKEGRKLKVTVVRNEENEEIEKLGNKETTVIVATKKSSSKNYQPVIATTLDKIREMDLGDRVRVSGVVAVEPGVLGSQYFYVVGFGSADSPPVGAQVYSYKKDFPILKVGDKVEVIGELSESYGERRIKTKTKIEIKKIGSGIEIIPQAAEISEIGEDNEGALVQIQGEMTDVKSAYLYLDDGSEEIKVAFKKGAGIDPKNFHVHDMLQIAGLVGQTKSGYQLMPRSEADIVKIGVAPVFASSTENTAAASANVAETYLTATAGGLTSILIGLFAKARGKLVFSLLRKIGSLAWVVVKRGPKV